MRLRSWKWGRHVYWIPSMWHSLWCSRCASLIGRLGFWFTALVLTLWVWIWPCKLICIKLPKWASITLQTWDQVYSLMNEEVQPEKIQSKLKKKKHILISRELSAKHTPLTPTFIETLIANTGWADTPPNPYKLATKSKQQYQSTVKCGSRNSDKHIKPRKWPEQAKTQVSKWKYCPPNRQTPTRDLWI